MHMWLASGKISSKKMLEDPRKRALNQVWSRAYKDCKFFKQTRVAITQAEIGKLLAVVVAGGIAKTWVLSEVGRIAVVPMDPTKLLSASNSALVATSTRSVLMKQWKRFGKEEYCKALQESSASEEAISERTPLTLGQPCN
jgi:hypothetical protein